MMTYLKKLRDSDPVDLSLYRQLIGSLVYLENTQLDIFLVGRLSYDINSDWVGSADEKISATWICFSLSFSTMPWATRKHNFVASRLQKQSILQLVMLVHKQFVSVSWFLGCLIRC
jgi:hypothetical protein